MHTSHKPQFESNPVTILIESAKSLFTVVPTLTVVAMVAPYAAWVFNIISQMSFDRLSVLLDKETESDPVLLVLIIMGIVLILLSQLLLQFFASAISVVTGALSTHKESTDIGTAFKLLIKRAWRLVGVGILIFLYIVPWLFALIGLLILTVYVSVNNYGYGAVVIPVAIVLGVVVCLFIYRIFLRYSMAGVAVYIDDLSISAAMITSKKLSEGRLIELFGITSIGTIIPILGIVLVPAGLARTYQQRKVLLPNANLGQPHLLNYLIIIYMIIIAGIFAAILFIIFVLFISTIIFVD